MQLYSVVRKTRKADAFLHGKAKYTTRRSADFCQEFAPGKTLERSVAGGARTAGGPQQNLCLRGGAWGEECIDR